MRQNKKKWLNTRMIVTLGLLVALEVVLSRFCSYAVWNMKIGFNFIPLVVAGILFGPLAGGIVGGLGDFIGAVLFPIGPYFPGFTLTHFLTGVVFGLFLHKSQTLPRILGSVAVNQLLLSLLLQTFWISLLYGSPYSGLLATRVFQCAVMLLIQTVTIVALSRVCTVQLRRALA